MVHPPGLRGIESSIDRLCGLIVDDHANDPGGLLDGSLLDEIHDLLAIRNAIIATYANTSRVPDAEIV